MELTFEECLKQLEDIIRKLESKDIALEEAVNNYQKGLELSKRCYDIFTKTQEAIVKQVEGDNITDFKAE